MRYIIALLCVAAFASCKNRGFNNAQTEANGSSHVVVITKGTYLKAPNTYREASNSILTGEQLRAKQAGDFGSFFCYVPAQTRLTITQKVSDLKRAGHYIVRGISKIEVPVEPLPETTGAQTDPSETTSQSENTLQPLATATPATFADIPSATEYDPVVEKSTDTVEVRTQEIDSCKLTTAFVFGGDILLGEAMYHETERMGPKTKAFLAAHRAYRGVQYVLGGGTDCTGSLQGALRKIGVHTSTVYFERDSKNFKRVNCRTDCRPGVIASHDYPRPHSWLMQTVVETSPSGGDCRHADNTISQMLNSRLDYVEGRLANLGYLRNPTVCVIPRVLDEEYRALNR